MPWQKQLKRDKVHSNLQFEGINSNEARKVWQKEQRLLVILHPQERSRENKKLSQAINPEVFTSCSEALPPKGFTNCPSSTRSWTTIVKHTSCLKGLFYNHITIITNQWSTLTSYISEQFLLPPRPYASLPFIKNVLLDFLYFVCVCSEVHTCHKAEAYGGGQISPSVR